MTHRNTVRGGLALPRPVHPGAWWIWALGLAVAASRTTNPLLLLLIVLVACVVVVARRPDAPWARSFRLYLVLGGVVVVMRVLYRVLFGGGGGPTVLLDLPRVRIPGWLDAGTGITLLGPVSAEAVLGGLYDGIRLATMIICVGAANALADPKRLLKSVPGALYEVGTAVVVALTVFPQLFESLLRVRRARRLRGGPERGRALLRSVAVPVLADALDRSLQLAASMDSRGFGRRGTASDRARLLTGTATVLGLLGACVGLYGVLDGTASTDPGTASFYRSTPLLLGGLLLAGIGLVVSGRRVRRSRYRPDPFGAPEWLTVATGVVAAAGLVLSQRVGADGIDPSLSPLRWPDVATAPMLAVLVAILPAVLTPRPVSGRGVPTTSAVRAEHVEALRDAAADAAGPAVTR